MTDDYMPQLPQGGWLTSEERQKMSGLNLAQSRISAAGALRRERQESEQSPRSTLTETELQMRRQAEYLEACEQRRIQSEQNRRGAERIQHALEAAAQPAEPELPQTDENSIDIDIPVEPEPTPEPSEPEKKKQSKKMKKSPAKRTASGGRYVTSGSTHTSYAGRITTGGAITFGVLTCILIGTVIYGRVQTNEIYTEIAALQAEYDDLVSKNISMKSEMEGKMTVKNIEEYAENVLGLMPLDQSQIQYIQLQTEDEVVISEPEDNFFVIFNDYLVNFWEFLRGV